MTIEPPKTPDPLTLWTDWTTIWQSELAGMAEDREITEQMVATTRLWASLAAVAAAGLKPGEQDGHANGASPATRTPAGTETPPAASGAGGDEVRRLERRVAELERRLDALAAAVPARPRRTKPKA